MAMVQVTKGFDAPFDAIRADFLLAFRISMTGVGELDEFDNDLLSTVLCRVMGIFGAIGFIALAFTQPTQQMVMTDVLTLKWHCFTSLTWVRQIYLLWSATMFIQNKYPVNRLLNNIHILSTTMCP
jgi:hypothetical protein